MRRTLIALGASLAFFSAGVAFAQSDASTTPATITFPIAELGDCASKTECKAYCDVAEHQQACLSYAETHGLMKKEDTDKARAVLSTKTGPGGCTSPKACKAYCADTTHQDECMSFAADHGLLNAAQKSVVQDIKQNGGPGGCTSPVACREYCGDATHHDECKAFAESHGLKPQSGQLMPKGNGAMGTSSEDKSALINSILAKTAGPGGCTTADACRTYCADASHKAECAAFAKANGLTAGGDGSMMRPASSTKPMMRYGSTTLPKLPPVHQPAGSTTRPMPRPDLEGSAAPAPADDGAAPAGGAGVLWGIMHFFGVK